MAPLAVFAVALITGFRPTTGLIEWLAAFGILALVPSRSPGFGVGLGPFAKTVEAASNLPMPLIIPPFLGSAFGPTDPMLGPVAWFAEYQPFTPIIETVRGLLARYLLIGWSAVVSIAWCAVIALGGYLWSMRLYNRDPIRLTTTSAGYRSRMVTIGSVVIRVDDLEREKVFWSAALDYVRAKVITTTSPSSDRGTAQARTYRSITGTLMSRSRRKSTSTCTPRTRPGRSGGSSASARPRCSGTASRRMRTT